MSETISKQNVAILGGGIGSLWTAFELSRTPELRKQYDITLHQMGWRLGGKLASSSNAEKEDRNEEHGLHVWFGSYANAFSNYKEIYDELKKIRPDYRWSDYLDAFVPVSSTPVGNRAKGKDGWWHFNWPHGWPGQPGEDDFSVEPNQAIERLFEIFSGHVVDEFQKANLAEHPFEIGLDVHILKHFAEAVEGVADHVENLVVSQAMDLARRWIAHLEHTSVTRDLHALGIIHFLNLLKGVLLKILGFVAEDDPDDHPVASIIDLLIAGFCGVLNPKYGILNDFNFNRINHLDTREFLLENGANEGVVEGSSLIRAWYDIPFQYLDGDISRPSYAAGSGAIFALYLGATYRSSFAYVPKAGFGEAVIAPIYEVLKARGVKFEFFHKVSGLELSEDKSQVARIRLQRQVEIEGGGAYKAVRWRDDVKLYSWPAEPDWAQIVDGQKMKKEGVNWESNWNQYPPAGEVVLENGKDYDLIVMGLALGAFKQLNDQDESICRELIEANDDFRAMTENLGLVSTIGTQYWFDKSLQELDWVKQPSSGGGPEPLDVWADMSQIIETEGWKDRKPLALGYLCGPLATTLYAAPTSDASVPARALEAAREITRQWTLKHGAIDWPGAATDGAFDWSVLFDPFDGPDPTAEQRFAAQFVRANIDPTECIVGSHAGTIQYRRKANQSGFSNLFLTGAWTYSGINVTCVEGATIASKICSRAICGSPQTIWGEDFLNKQESGE